MACTYSSNILRDKKQFFLSPLCKGIPSSEKTELEILEAQNKILTENIFNAKSFKHEYGYAKVQIE